ncbi:hypothetical protein KH5_07100 [Urechidicola sp. KH5]
MLARYRIKNLKILLPGIICVLVLFLTNMSIWYYPITFGLVIGLLNFRRHVYQPFIGVLLSLAASLVSFWAAYFCLGVFTSLRKKLYTNNEIIVDDLTFYDALITPFVITPLLTFFFYRHVFKIGISRSGFFVIIASVLLLILVFSFFWFYLQEFNFSNKLPYMIWQLIMATALQILINKKVN